MNRKWHVKLITFLFWHRGLKMQSPDILFYFCKHKVAESINISFINLTQFNLNMVFATELSEHECLLFE